MKLKSSFWSSSIRDSTFSFLPFFRLFSKFCSSSMIFADFWVIIVDAELIMRFFYKIFHNYWSTSWDSVFSLGAQLDIWKKFLSWDNLSSIDKHLSWDNHSSSDKRYDFLSQLVSFLVNTWILKFSRIQNFETFSFTIALIVVADAVGSDEMASDWLIVTADSLSRTSLLFILSRIVVSVSSLSMASENISELKYDQNIKYSSYFSNFQKFDY